MSELVGQVLNRRYRVEASLGRGSMAEVYKVWDEERATYLALKLLREDLAQDPVFIRRFKREAQTLAKLQHPNIVRFYGLEQDGLLAFMLMDFVEGTSLRAEIFQSQGRGLSPQRMLEIMQAVCSSLHYAHRRGMVHCDVKPGNILIDKTGRVLLTDFGIARMTESATATMVGAGTPAYMSPEQARGKDPTPQTDIYALGVVLFEMLTGGERPFTGEHGKTTGSTSEKVRWEQMHLKPPSPRKFNPEISPELEAVVLMCLAKKPAERYGSALELLNELQTTTCEQIITAAVAIPSLPLPSAPQLPLTPAYSAPSPPLTFAASPPSHAATRHLRRSLGQIMALIVLLGIGLALGGGLLKMGQHGQGPLAGLAADTPTAIPTLMSTKTQTPTLTSTPTKTHTPTETPTPMPAAPYTYIVQEGDYLGKIITDHGLSDNDLLLILQLNPFIGSALDNSIDPIAQIVFVGQKITLPPPGMQMLTATPLPTNAAPGVKITYVILPGDTLGSIARKLNSTVAAIVAANKDLLKDGAASAIYPGWTLVVPVNLVTPWPTSTLATVTETPTATSTP